MFTVGPPVQGQSSPVQVKDPYTGSMTTISIFKRVLRYWDFPETFRNTITNIYGVFFTAMKVKNFIGVFLQL